MGKFIISTRKNGEYQFNLNALNGKIILTSEGYTTKNACLNGITSVKKNSGDINKFEQLTAKNGKFYFNLKATNGQIIGASQMYKTEAGRSNGIKSVQTNAPDAETVDTTA